MPSCSRSARVSTECCTRDSASLTHVFTRMENGSGVSRTTGIVNASNSSPGCSTVRASKSRGLRTPNPTSSQCLLSCCNETQYVGECSMLTRRPSAERPPRLLTNMHSNPIKPERSVRCCTRTEVSTSGPSVSTPRIPHPRNSFRAPTASDDSSNRARSSSSTRSTTRSNFARQPSNQRTS